MAAETAGKHYSAAFRDRPIQIWSGHESARTSIVLARLLAEDAAAAEVRNDYEAAYERYFASADALFRAARALDTGRTSSASPSVLDSGVNATHSCCDSGQDSCREGASSAEATMRTLCYRQIEALIARCEAIREYLYASTMAEHEPVDSSSDENSAIAVNTTGEKTNVAATKAREAIGIGSESIGPQLQRRFEACRTMQEALEQSRSAAWLLDAAAIPAIPQQGHERASAPLRNAHGSTIASCDHFSRPRRESGPDLCDVLGLPCGERQDFLDERGTSASPSEPKTPSPGPVRRFLLHSPAMRLSSGVSSDTKASFATNVLRGATWQTTPENPITEDANGTLTKRIASSRADAAILSGTRVPTETPHHDSTLSDGLLRGALQEGAFPAALAASAVQDSEQLRDDLTLSDWYHLDLGQVPNKAVGGSLQSIDSQNRGNRTPPAVRQRASVSPSELHSPECSARRAGYHASCSASDDTSPFRSVLDEPTDQNPLDQTPGTMDAAASGAASAAQQPDSESAAAIPDARLIIQRELARRFRELRQRQQDRHAEEHPSDQPSPWFTDDVPNTDARPAQAAPHDTTFDTTFSSGWHSNHSSISRSRYEAMKTRVALMKERLGKMMLAGNATATIVMPVASQNETFSVQRVASRETTPKSTLPRTASSSPGSLGAASNALQLSHAIVNLHAGTFGEFKRLEPLPVQAASRWSMEIDFLLSPCEQIMVRTPVRRQLADGTSVEVLESRLRPDIEEYLPRLRGMDQAIREMLRSFRELSGTLNYEPTGTRGPQWWLEQPQIPPGGLPPGVRALLQRNFQEAADIRHLARDVNERVLRSLPCPAREYACSCFGYDLTEATGGWSLTPRRRPAARVRDVLGPELHEALSRNPAFSAVAYARSAVLGLSSDTVLPSWIEADDINERLTRLVEQLERAEFLYRVKIDRLNQAGRFGAPWRREKLERYYAARRRCERGAHALREVFTGIGHTTRDQCAIRYNVDVGSAILEAYSRVLEHRAAAICKRIRLCLEIEQQQQQQQQQQTLNETAHVSLRASSSRLEAFHSRRRDASALGGRQQRESHLSHRGCALERPRTMPNGSWARDHWGLGLGRSTGTQVDINRSNERPLSRIPDPAGILPARSTGVSLEPSTPKATAYCLAETSARRRPTPLVASGAETLPARRIPMTTWSDQVGSSAAPSEHRKSNVRPRGQPPSWHSGCPGTHSEQGPV
ncbi:hypothetical protein CCYA_CCYA14G3831 [Cyanidiococcus yangmingshanensis]|nr:hypothetical protein CCYA_CCYA14G3831 [Cyanidiococcus yangmingshanensis]